MTTHRQQAEEAAKVIPPTGDDRIAKRGQIHALLDIADAVRETYGVVDAGVVDDDKIAAARELATAYTGYDGEHHKQHALVTIAELLGGRVPDGTDRGIPA